MLLKLTVCVGFVLLTSRLSPSSAEPAAPGPTDFHVPNAFPLAVPILRNRIQMTKALSLHGFSRSWEPWDIYAKIQELNHWLHERANATACGRDVLNFVVALGVRKEQWAFAMLDAFGKIGSGITQGNIMWTGDYNLCRKIKATPAVNASFFTPFETQYCWLSFSLLPAATKSEDVGDMPMNLRTSICVPDTCSSAELANMTQFLLEFVPMMNSFLNFTGVSCVPKELNMWEDLGTVVAFGICCVFIMLMLAGTVYDVYFKNDRRLSQFEYNPQFDSNTHLDEDQNHSVNKTEPSDGEKIDENNSPPSNSALPSSTVKQSNLSTNKSPHGIAEGLLLAFSVYTNGKKILSLAPGKETITVLNGLRFFSMTWVILGHTFMLGCFNLDNLTVIIDVSKTFLFQIVIQGVYAVDTFFLLSGFLVTYLFLKEYDKVDGKISWFRFYFHRFWRLTPPYMLVLFLFHMRLSKYFSNGPFWPEVGWSGPCEKNWWWNLLYINNFNKMNDMCMGWTWYLANDMQFFVISPVLLIPMAKRSTIITSIVAACLLLTCSLCNGVISSHYGLNYGMDITEMGPGSQKYVTMFQEIYIKPYTRVGPYVIGMLSGWLLYKYKQVHIKTHWVAAGWLAAVVIALSVIIGTFHTHPSQAVASLYYSLSKIAWSISVCWVIFACATGHGGFVNSLLSWPAWNPLSRLTYMAYLWHYILLMAVFYSVEVSGHFSYTFFVFYYLAAVLISYMCALIFSLAFESPFLALEKLMFQH